MNQDYYNNRDMEIYVNSKERHSFNLGSIITIAGCALSILAQFLPYVKNSLGEFKERNTISSFSFFEAGIGIPILIVGIIVLIATLIRSDKGSIISTLIQLIAVFALTSTFNSEIEKEYADLFLPSVGYYLMIIGSIIEVIGAFTALILGKRELSAKYAIK